MANPASLERSPPELDTGTGRRGRERRRATDPTARSPKVGDSLAYGPPGQRKCEWTAYVPMALYSWVAPTAEQRRPWRRAGFCPHGPRDTAAAVGEANMLYRAAHYLGITWEFGQVSILRSCEQQANLLCDDDAEPLVIQGVEVDAVGVARPDLGAGIDPRAGASVRDRRIVSREVAGPLDGASELLREQAEAAYRGWTDEECL